MPPAETPDVYVWVAPFLVSDDAMNKKAKELDLRQPEKNPMLWNSERWALV